MKRKFRLSLLILSVFLVLQVSTENIPVSEQRDVVSLEEVVISLPVETTLKGIGIRRASDVWVEMINSAERTLDFAEFYIISQKNELLEPVIEALKSASKRGVKIRFLIDKKMIHTSAPLMKRFKMIKGMEVRIFNWEDLSGGILHAKYFIVDNKVVFIGSQNFDWRALKHIHETGLKIIDPGAVGNLIRIFEADWAYSGGDKNAYEYKNGGPEILSNPDVILTASPEKYNPPGISGSLKMIKKLINGAEKKITIQLLNYKTQIYKSDYEFTELHTVLKRAAERGVRIKMAVSDWNLEKPGIGSIKALAKVKGIIVKIFSIPEYSKGFIPYSRVIHSKVLRVDDNLSMVSTSNWGHGYFYDSRNVEVTLRLKNIALILDNLFDELWNSEYGSILDPGKDYVPRKTH